MFTSSREIALFYQTVEMGTRHEMRKGNWKRERSLERAD